jgi:hypothetical protein
VQWSRSLDEEFEEMMDGYSQLEPALERVCRTEDRMNQLEQDVHAVLPRLMELMLDLARRLGRQEIMEGQ